MVTEKKYMDGNQGRLVKYTILNTTKLMWRRQCFFYSM